MPTIATDLNVIGLVTNATSSDFDMYSDADLSVVGESMSPVFSENDEGVFRQVVDSLNHLIGWYFSITSQDIDVDRDMDFLLGIITLLLILSDTCNIQVGSTNVNQ